MKRAITLLTLAVVAVLMMSETTALADLLPNGGGGRPRPRPRPPIEQPAPQPAVDTGVPLTYREDANASTSRLILPRRYLEQAGWRKTAGGPDDAADHVAQAESPTRTIVAGVALSLAAVSLVLMRRKSRAVQGTLLVVALGVSAFAATQLLTAAEPRDKVDPQGGSAKVVIEIVEEGDGVQFVRGTR